MTDSVIFCVKYLNKNKYLDPYNFCKRSNNFCNECSVQIQNEQLEEYCRDKCEQCSKYRSVIDEKYSPEMYELELENIKLVTSTEIYSHLICSILSVDDIEREDVIKFLIKQKVRFGELSVREIIKQIKNDYVKDQTKWTIILHNISEPKTFMDIIDYILFFRVPANMQNNNHNSHIYDDLFIVDVCIAILKYLHIEHHPAPYIDIHGTVITLIQKYHTVEELKSLIDRIDEYFLPYKISESNWKKRFLLSPIT